MAALKIKNDFSPKRPLALNPWLVDYKKSGNKIPQRLLLHKGIIPAPYNALIEKRMKAGLGRSAPRQSMRSASHASSNDGATPRIYGFSLLDLMREHSFPYSILLYWLGHEPKHDFEVNLFEKVLTASLTNGPGTISAQGAKLSASAGNNPNTAMMATLGSIGSVHGGNGREAAELLIDVFGKTGLKNPYAPMKQGELDALANKFITGFKKRKAMAKEAGIEYRKIPCLGHPVFNKEEVNYDPREQVVSEFLAKKRLHNVFLEFYHKLAIGLMQKGATNKAHAVNVDAAIACVCLGIAWPLLIEKKITIERAVDLPMLTFALGRVAGGAGEFLDRRESGTAMDMRVPVSECVFLGRVKE
jgi:citrate synthase